MQQRLHFGLYALVAWALLAGALLSATRATQAQLASPRTLEELKDEILTRVDRQAYPLAGLDPADVREALAALHSLDRDEWAAAWSMIAERYRAAAEAQESTDPRAASEHYLRAWRYYSFARWPVPNSPGKQRAYERALDAYLRHAQQLDPPLEVVRIPFEGAEIIGYLRLPAAPRPAPVVLAISALDSRKEEVAERSAAFLPHGIGFFAVDMPGTGQAPIKIDVGAERMFSRILDYLQARPDVDGARLAVQGGSWSGHWAARLAFVERERLRGAVAQGAPVHEYFQPEWQLEALGTREYLFDLFPARASVYGVETLEEFLAYGPRLSLVTAGLIDQPAAPMLLVNGERDTQVPIADLYWLLRHGTPKEAWVNPQGGHMGRSADWPDERIFQQAVLPWLVRVLQAS
jgi:hypothetical protein